MTYLVDKQQFTISKYVGQLICRFIHMKKMKIIFDFSICIYYTGHMNSNYTKEIIFNSLFKIFTLLHVQYILRTDIYGLQQIVTMISAYYSYFVSPQVAWKGECLCGYCRRTMKERRTIWRCDLFGEYTESVQLTELETTLGTSKE